MQPALATDLCAFEQITPADADAVGGKGLSLGRLAAAGLPVPPGFCLTSATHRRLRGQSLHADPALREQIAAAYAQLGAGPVAVRSSATAEDGAVTSFAGQQDTILGVQGSEAVCAAIERCWASLDSDRAVAYRRHHGVSDAGLAMAVVVQRMVRADVSGVLFTADPLSPEGRQMLVEASWGLGEPVVSGRVSPDRYHLDHDTGAVRDKHIARKLVQATLDGEQPVPDDKQERPCLTDEQLVQLAELGRRVEALYGEPRDVEWAWEEGRFWLLQARPITAAGAAEREQVRREEIALLAGRIEPAGTVWARYNLSESLPEPTPMTWSVVRGFMSGRGGYGLMYRDLGFRPHSSLDDEGVYDLVAGRPYCNLSREPLLYSRWLPYEHPFAVLKRDPNRALYPIAVRNPARAGPLFWLTLPLRLPFIIVGSVRFALRLGHLTRTFAGHFCQQVLPPFVAECVRAGGEDWGALAPAALVAKLAEWIQRTLYDYGRDSLKPTALAAMSMANLERWLKRKLGPDRTRGALNELSMGARPAPEADLAGAVADLVAGRLERATFLANFGHRGSHEMELARPRWAEEPATLDHYVRRGSAPSAVGEGQVSDWWERIVVEAKLSALERTALEPEYRALHTYLGLRETAKHYLMAGYALIRRALVGLDKRFGLQGGIFYLALEDLPRLLAGEDLTGLIAQRRRRRMVALSLEAPPVLFSDDLEALGRPAPPVAGAEALKGVPVSAGVAEAPALVLEEPPEGDLPAGPYILVCPSTDPAWVPLFVQARGLVMETGGVLSHGAIVARELGLPAVAGLAGAQRRLRSGQRLRVDGGTGTVTVLPE
jgi:pyruvate,water dikinase